MRSEEEGCLRRSEEDWCVSWSRETNDWLMRRIRRRRGNENYGGN